jgi:hypothetical protein
MKIFWSTYRACACAPASQRLEHKYTQQWVWKTLTEILRFSDENVLTTLHLFPMCKLLYILLLFTSTGWDYVSELQPVTGLLFIPQMIYIWYMCTESHCRIKLTRETRIIRRKPVPVPLCPPQQGLTRARTRTTPVRGWRLTAWAMSRPEIHITITIYKQGSSLKQKWWRDLAQSYRFEEIILNDNIKPLSLILNDSFTNCH